MIPDVDITLRAQEKVEINNKKLANISRWALRNIQQRSLENFHETAQREREH